MEYYFRKMNYIRSENLQWLIWYNDLWNWIQNEVGIQLGNLLKKEIVLGGRGFWLQWVVFVASSSAFDEWRSLEFIGECRAFWNDELLSWNLLCVSSSFGILSASQLWVPSSSCLVCFGILSGFESRRALCLVELWNFVGESALSLVGLVESCLLLSLVCITFQMDIVRL